MASRTDGEASMLRQALSRREAFPAPHPACVEVRETHVSWVFMGDREVFKVKKPVDLGFLDFSTLERRKSACEAEVVLNARLALDAYLGVVPVCRGRDGALTFGGTGTIVDWAVRMRRMADSTRFDRLLVGRRLTGPMIDRVADWIAAFHATARCDKETAAYGARGVIARNVTESFAQTRDVLGKHLADDEAREIETWHLAFLRDNASLFERRIAQRRIRDGHGDLRLEHLYVDPRGALTILDCIEFNQRFRYADVCADIAFLSMDLAWHGRVDLAERLLARYARTSGDYDLYALVDFYESYRAYVRGKVATMLAADGGAAEALRADASRDARRYFLLALAGHRRSLLGPALVCVGGIIASGKSTIADAIAQEMSAPVVEADRTRKQMLGIDPSVRIDDPAWKNAYDPAFTETVYAEVLRRARVVVESGRPVVVDASFRSAAQRRAARDLARALGVPFHMVECHASAPLCRARLLERERHTGVSDGRLSIFDDFCARFEPMNEMPERLVVESSRVLSQTLTTVCARVQTWPRGFVT